MRYGREGGRDRREKRRHMHAVPPGWHMHAVPPG